MKCGDKEKCGPTDGSGCEHVEHLAQKRQEEDDPAADLVREVAVGQR